MYTINILHQSYMYVHTYTVVTVHPCQESMVCVCVCVSCACVCVCVMCMCVYFMCVWCGLYVYACMHAGTLASQGKLTLKDKHYNIISSLNMSYKGMLKFSQLIVEQGLVKTNGPPKISPPKLSTANFHCHSWSPGPTMAAVNDPPDYLLFHRLSPSATNGPP